MKLYLFSAMKSIVSESVFTFTFMQAEPHTGQLNSSKYLRASGTAFLENQM